MERKEAIEIVRKLYNDSLFLKKDKEAVATLIPELAESEDERIRKELLLDIPKVFPHDKAFRYIAYLEKQGEQKDILEDATIDNNEDGLIADTIKAKGKQKPWSEEDELNLSEALHHIRMYNLANKAGKLDKWLKDLKDRVLPHPKQEWSDEDKKMMRNIISDIQCGTSFNHEVKQEANRREAWFKDLCSRLQWKPSDEQLDSLYDVLNPCDGFNREVLESLYVQLKKLREE